MMPTDEEMLQMLTSIYQEMPRESGEFLRTRLMALYIRVKELEAELRQKAGWTAAQQKEADLWRGLEQWANAKTVDFPKSDDPYGGCGCPTCQMNREQAGKAHSDKYYYDACDCSECQAYRERGAKDVASKG